MSKYEDLLRRSDLCYATSNKVRGFMRTVWQIKAMQLKEMAENLSVTEASKKVGE